MILQIDTQTNTVVHKWYSIEMIKQAKIGIAYNAKPILKEHADIQINEKDLRKVLDIMTDEEKITKEEVVEEVAVDYTKMTVAELKEVAAAKNVDVAGMKKAEIIEALTK